MACRDVSSPFRSYIKGLVASVGTTEKQGSHTYSTIEVDGFSHVSCDAGLSNRPSTSGQASIGTLAVARAIFMTATIIFHCIISKATTGPTL